MEKFSDTIPPQEPVADAQPPKKDEHDNGDAEARSIRAGENDLLKGEIVDLVLAAKMNLVNDVSAHKHCLAGNRVLTAIEGH
jgi:hypothetical protein